MNNNAYKVTIGEITDKQNIDNIYNYVINHYENDIKLRPSFHKYVVKLPDELQTMIKKVRESKEIYDSICKQFDQCDITELSEIDELYISHYNIDKGGDQGLFEKHYDGVLKMINNATIIRVLVYINSNDNYIVHFLDSNVSYNFKKYEYGILDFNKEYHYVEGKFNYNVDGNTNNSRILLKLNYLVCPKCNSFYRNFIIFINNSIFYFVKKCMEYSKSPQTPFEYFIGFFCNFFRKLNNINTYLCIAIVFIFIILIIYFIVFIIKLIINLINKKNKKLNK
jgi:hypothetical protein